MYNAINFAFASETSQLPFPANSTVERAVIQVFLCPSDGQQRVDPVNWGERTMFPTPERERSTAATSTSSPVRHCPTVLFTTPARFGSPRSSMV